LKRAVSHQHDRAQRGVRKTGSQRGGHCKSHGRVIGRRKELCASMDTEISGGKERFSNVRDDESLFIQQTVEVSEQAAKRDAFGWRGWCCRDRLRGGQGWQ